MRLNEIIVSILIGLSALTVSCAKVERYHESTLTNDQASALYSEQLTVMNEALTELTEQNFDQIRVSAIQNMMTLEQDPATRHFMMEAKTSEQFRALLPFADYTILDVASTAQPIRGIVSLSVLKQEAAYYVNLVFTTYLSPTEYTREGYSNLVPSSGYENFHLQDGGFQIVASNILDFNPEYKRRSIVIHSDDLDENGALKDSLKLQIHSLDQTTGQTWLSGVVNGLQEFLIHF